MTTEQLIKENLDLTSKIGQLEFNIEMTSKTIQITKDFQTRTLRNQIDKYHHDMINAKCRENLLTAHARIDEILHCMLLCNLMECDEVSGLQISYSDEMYKLLTSFIHEETVKQLKDFD